ncbi:MAG: metallophosphoesterase [Christensenellales bacterium]|jgi:predicted phosphohydrolase
MNVYAISDLHLTGAAEKPMDIFGPAWEGHFDKISKHWIKNVSDEDIVLLAGDLSWAMRLSEAVVDLKGIGALPGRKVIIKGNHDFWWGSVSKVREALPENIYAIQNEAVKIDNVIICGSRGWINTGGLKDRKIYDRELIRLELSLKAMRNIYNEGDRVIGLTHFPPFSNNLDSMPMTELFSKYGVTKVVYGHLHLPNKIDKVIELKGVRYYLTSCDILKNKLIKID